MSVKPFRICQALLGAAATLFAATCPAESASPEELPKAPVHELLARPDQLRLRLSELSPQVGAARFRVVQARADASTTRLIPNPVLDASLSGIPLGTGGGVRFRDSTTWNVGVSETIELGKRGPRQAAADLRSRAAQSYYTGAVSDRIGDARLAMANALHLMLRTATLEESMHDAERATALEKVRYEQKALAGMDYDRLLLELENLTAEVAHSQADYQAALADCNAILFGACDLAGTREEDLDSSLPLDEKTATSADLRQRPDVQGNLLEGQAARKDADLARGRQIPDLSLRVGYVRDNTAGAGAAADALSVGVTLPLPIADRGQHDAAKALAHARELDETRAATLLAARAELTGLLHRKQALEHTLSVLERDSLPRAKSVLESTQQAFDHGGISLTDFLLARRSYVGMRLTLLEQRYELFTVRNDLYRVLGLDARSTENAR
ncbi:MAG: TolC family protein [Polyangiaceae bacterium]